MGEAKRRGTEAERIAKAKPRKRKPNKAELRKVGIAAGLGFLMRKFIKGTA